MGAITDIVRQNVPASYRAMIGASLYTSYYSLDDLQNVAENVQYRLFATIAGVSNESGVYNPLELELLGVVTTMQFIPAAIDYWGDQLSSQNTSGTNEDVAYFDRRPDLWKVWDKLAARAAELSDETGVNIAKLKASVPKVSYGDNGRGILVTPDPADWPGEYDYTTVDTTIPWSEPA